MDNTQWTTHTTWNYVYPAHSLDGNVAMSQDGIVVLRTSATMGTNKQGVAVGKVRVFELLVDITNT
jgi:hypothetical protein